MTNLKPIEFIRIDITNKCNLNCTICYASDKNIGDLPTEKIFEMIDKIENFGIKRIIISGGEPFLRNDLREIVIYAYEKEMKIDLVTNGTLLKENDVEFLRKYINELSISLDGDTEKLNNKTRDSFQKVVENIKILRKNNVKFNLITVVTKFNADKIDGIIEFGQKLGAKKHDFIRFVPLGKGNQHSELCPSDEEWFHVVEELKGSDRLLFDQKYITGTCRAGINFLCILPNGDMTICTRKYKKGWILGNIFNDDIKNIWENSPILIKARKTKRTNCTTCDF